MAKVIKIHGNNPLIFQCSKCFAIVQIILLKTFPTEKEIDIDDVLGFECANCENIIWVAERIEGRE